MLPQNRPKTLRDQCLSLGNERGRRLSFGDHRVYPGRLCQALDLVSIVGGEQNKSYLRQHFPEYSRRFKSIHDGHGQIQDDQVRLEQFCLIDCILAIFRFP